MAVSSTLLSLALAFSTVGFQDLEPPRIFGGEPAQPCQWPTTVSTTGGNAICTGTLVHPEIVIFAAHCSTPLTVAFGESAQGVGMARQIPVDHCKRRVDENQISPDDYAYCKLSEPVTDVPITPPVYGCELDRLERDVPVTIVGFGMSEDGPAGTKYVGETVITAMEDGNNMLLIGGNGVSAFMGDSGGPVYIQYEDDHSWHPFGIVSGGMAAGDPGQYVKMWTAVPWIEQESGVDITPCHDVDGTWNPGPDCGGFATNPGSTGDWENGCQDGDPRSGYAATCGAPAVDDDEGPSVTITAPSNGESFPGPTADIVVSVDASDELTGVRKVWVRIEQDGMAPMEFEQDAISELPYEFPAASFPEGAYVLTAIAEDLTGNVSESAPIGFAVGDVEPPEVEDGETGDGDPSGMDEQAGCGCQAGAPRTPAPLLLLGLFAIAGRRRVQSMGGGSR